jgi:fructokinase
MGGFLAWWHHRGLARAELADINEVTDAAAFACRVAAETCARAGADPPRLAL